MFPFHLRCHPSITTSHILRVLRLPLVLLVVVVSFGTTACDQEKSKKANTPGLNVNPVLEGVSSTAAYLELKNSLLKRTKCIASEVARDTKLPKEKADKNKPENEAAVNRFINAMVDRYKNLCDLFIEVEKNTQPVFKQIQRDQKMPNELYAFSIFLEKTDSNLDEPVFTKEEVGLFDSKRSCEVIEAFAHVRNIPVQRCRKWEDIMKLAGKPEK